MTREMAERSTLRIDFAPLHSGVYAAWKTLAAMAMSRSNLKATSFGPIIQPLDKGDQTQAFAMYAGIFNFTSESQTCSPAQIFDINQASKEWQRQLYDLHWLKHFSASNSTLHAHFAIRLIGRWANSKKSPRDIESLCKIVIALATHGQVLAQKCNTQVQAEFLFVFTQQFKKLQRKSAHNSTMSTTKAIAELYAIAAFRGLESALPTAADALQTNINKTILPDGGHIARDPAKLLQLLALLIPLQKALKASGHHVSFAMIDRMMPMLRLLTHGDGSLAHTENSRALTDLVQSVLKTDLHKAKSHPLATQSGFAKLEGKHACLIADTKNNFAIEFSEGQQFLLKNDVSLSKTAEKADLKQSTQGNLLHMASAQGFERSCFLSADGTDLRVEDIHPGNIELRFEIHPEIKISSLREGRGFMLVSPDRIAWNLSFRGAEIHTEQNGSVIKVINQDHRCINWALKKQVKPTKSGSRTKSSEPDLLDL
jgi:uncharacterized heparinase superfamily protein